MLQDSYVNQRHVTARTVAEVVGVVPKKTIYTEVIKSFVDFELNELLDWAFPL